MKSVNFKKTLFEVLTACAAGVLIGAVGGLVGGCFSHSLSFVTNVRGAAPWLVLFLPLGGIVTVLLYRVFRMIDYGGTNEIIQRLKDGGRIRVIAAPLIFVSTAITHLLGGSAGREGAALQLGGSIAASLSGAFRLKGKARTTLIMCSMSAVFAGVFGTPLTAAFFVLEFALGAKMICRAFFPCLVSAMVAEKISSLMGVAEETVHLGNIAPFSIKSIAQIIVLSLLLCVLGRIVCLSFHGAERWAKKLISNSILRALLGASIIVALTALVGDMRYNGAGMDMAIGALEGEAEWFDFILKIAFTAVTLAAGFKGGEIVPTFCIGATFGCVLGGALGMDAGLAAALGLVGLFCCATNSLVSAVFLGIELFGFAAAPYYLLVCLILCPLSVNKGLFDNRFFKPKALLGKTKLDQNGQK